MLSVYGKNRMHLIFLGNLLLKCFLQQARIYNLTLTTKSRRSRSAVFRTPSIWKVHWPILAVKPWAKATGGSTSLNSGRANFFPRIPHSIYCCWTIRDYQTKIKGLERNCKSNQSLTVGQRNNPSWHLVWKGCLTANNSGTVINAKRVTLSLIKRLGGIWHFTGQRCGKVKKMKKRGFWKFLSIVFSILQFQKISIPTTRVVFGLSTAILFLKAAWS